MARTRPLIRLLLLLLLAPALAAAARAETTIYVTSNGWHTGIAIARADLPPGLVPEAADFPSATHFEFGWGNRDYYTTPRKTLGLTLGAALPGAAVVHLAAYGGPPRGHAGHEVVALRVSGEGMRRLAAYLHAGFARGGAPRVRTVAPGLLPASAFYPGSGTFHLFNTCNTWVAAGLAAAGLPVRAAGVQLAEELMSQLRRLARAEAPAQ
ncbi:MAG: DUF2459 domain-containing protein [Candidatus Odyssella sp.]|nr:DUF2459 domain-containing protein [Candidatus Odyssella sp.]